MNIMPIVKLTASGLLAVTSGSRVWTSYKSLRKDRHKKNKGDVTLSVKGVKDHCLDIVRSPIKAWNDIHEDESELLKEKDISPMVGQVTGIVLLCKTNYGLGDAIAGGITSFVGWKLLHKATAISYIGARDGCQYMKSRVAIPHFVLPKFSNPFTKEKNSVRQNKKTAVPVLAE